jgi:signal transduction histidine kinase
LTANKKTMSALRKHYVLISTLIGALVGDLVFHPVSDLIYTLFEKNERLGIYGDTFSFHLVWDIVKNTISPHDLPDALVYIILSGLLGYFFGLIMNEHHKIEEHLKRFSAIGMNTSSILHDLGNPVTGIIGFTKLIKAEPGENVRGDYCDRIISSAEMISRMMIDIKTAAQGSMSLVLSPAPNNLKKIIDTVVALVRPHSSLHIDVAEDIEVLVDTDYFERVLWNLIKNADEATKENNDRKIEIASQRGGGTVTITIRDNGPGFPKELSRRIFTLGATFGKKGGSGIGLYNCKKIMEAHGGTIRIDSDPGKWTGVVVRVPAAIASQP